MHWSFAYFFADGELTLAVVAFEIFSCIWCKKNHEFHWLPGCMMVKKIIAHFLLETLEYKYQQN